MIRPRTIRHVCCIAMTIFLGRAWGAPPAAASARAAAAAQLKAVQASREQAIRELARQRTRQAVALSQTSGLLLLDAQMVGVQQRMGALRDGGKGGLWATGGGTRLHADTDDTAAFKARMGYGAVGGDYGWRLGRGSLYLGLYGGTGQADIDDGASVSGKLKSRFVGGYLTYFEEDGWYVDLASQVGSLESEIRVDMPEIGRAYDNQDTHQAFTGSIETGYHFALRDDWFVEPQAQLLYEHSSQHSVMGRLGVRAGRDLSVSEDGRLQPCLTLSYLAQLAQDDEVEYGGQSVEAALPDGRWRVGAGVAFDRGGHRAYADLRYGHGPDVSQETAVMVGYAYRF
ncbi:autotransporter [Bordetella hinzii]|nr:autotransporter [Bordetella hinzii]